MAYFHKNNACFPTNTDPRRNIPYIPPSPSRSEPLSHAEYLRIKKANNNVAISNNALKTANATVERYNTTIWTEQHDLPTACTPLKNTPVPSVHPGGKALDAGMITMMEGSVAARGKISIYDTTNHNESNTTYRRQGLAIVRDPTYKAPAGGKRIICKENKGCVLEGTKDVVPGNPPTEACE